MIDALPCAAVLCDTEGTLSAYNTPFAGAIGRDGALLAGTRYRALVHADDGPGFDRELSRACGDPFDVRLTSSDGGYRWYRLQAVRVEHGDILVTATDIDALKRANSSPPLPMLPQDVLDRLPAFLMVKDTENNVLLANAAATDLFDVTLETLTTNNVYDLFDESAAREWHQQDLDVIRSGQPALGIHAAFECRGEVRHYVMNKVPFVDSADGSQRVIVMGLDVTPSWKLKLDLEQRLRELQTREREVRLLLDHVPAMIFIKDDRGTVLRANKLGHEFFGVAEGQLEGRNCAELDPARAAAWLAEEQEIIASGQPLQKLNLDFSEVFGERSWWRTDKAPWCDETTGARGVVVICHDITRQYIAARALEHRNREIALVLDAVPAMVYFKDSGNNIRRTNRLGAKLFGRTPELMIGCSFAELAPVQADEFLAIDHEVMQSGASRYGLEHELHLSDGSSRWVRGSVAPFTNEQGAVDGVVVALADITDEKARDREIEAVIEQLTRSNRELERFAKVAAHDLREPLRMLTSYTTLIDDEYARHLDEQGRIYLRFAREGAERMTTLIEDLLEYSRMGSAETVEPVELDQALDFALANLHEPIARRAVVVERAGLATVSGNLVRIARVLQNLVHNAIKFTPDDTVPRIQVAFERLDGYVQISVSDNGIGIPPEQAEAVFEPFSRLHTRQDFPGNGIGLPICRRIIEQAGGHIWVDTDIDRGARFVFTLPDGASRDQWHARARR